MVYWRRLKKIKIIKFVFESNLEREFVKDDLISKKSWDEGKKAYIFEIVDWQ